MKKKLVIAFYAHQEHYPPTLNAIAQLAGIFDEIAILYRNNAEPPKWDYPPNVSLHPSGDAATIKAHEQASRVKKLRYFGRFVLSLGRLIRQKKADVVLCYDPHALSAYSFSRHLTGGLRPLLWYHNHDVLEAQGNPFSITGIGKRREPLMFPHIDIFSLPSQERKPYFPMDKLKGQYFFLPNLPAVDFYGKTSGQKRDDSSIRIIFQGNLSTGHGFEEIISLMPLQLGGRQVKLVLAGWLREEYKKELMPLIERNGVQEHVEFAGYIPYKKLPELTASCHIGNAIYASSAEVMNRTVGTASNKIYEYAAVGLPVLYFDNPHFREHLGQYEWAIPTDLTPDNLRRCLEKMVDEYDRLSKASKEDFMENLNYEKVFEPVAEYLRLVL